MTGAAPDRRQDQRADNDWARRIVASIPRPTPASATTEATP